MQAPVFRSTSIAMFERSHAEGARLIRAYPLRQEQSPHPHGLHHCTNLYSTWFGRRVSHLSFISGSCFSTCLCLRKRCRFSKIGFDT
mmetsp:Transcript_98458/g.287119  ORF Transcript_98458/g.287119 Transcript_98458/m.287119 type:complete len:87 (+) Transcript_98458:121-381(+)